MTSADRSTHPESGTHGVGHRRFLGYVLAAPTLVAAAELGGAPEAAAGIPSPEPTELLDLNDVMTAAALPTSNLITVEVHADGTVSFALPRAEVGQGITTSTAMLIAEELDVPLERVRVTLADARPELLFNQLTGASNTTVSTYRPIRVAAAVARGRLLQAAAVELGAAVTDLTLRAGVVTDLVGRSIGIGALAEKAASIRTQQVAVELKPREDFTVIGTPRNRVDALAAVTGRKKFAMDLDVPDAGPTMVCRPPTINGTVGSVSNLDEVRAMPGVTDAVVISTGVAVRAKTFGQCIDAVRALHVDWRPGTAEGQSDESVLDDLRAAELPLGLPPLTPSVEGKFTFHFRGNSALEPNCAIADVRSDRAEIWASLKSPIVAQQTIAARLGLPAHAVTVHVTQGGGSFGRKLFFDAAPEAAEASQKMGKPVKLMWHRADDCRQGRTHPMATSRVRITYLGDTVLGYQQRHTSVAPPISAMGSARSSPPWPRGCPWATSVSPRRSSSSPSRCPTSSVRAAGCSARRTRTSTPGACATSARRTSPAPENSSSTGSRPGWARTPSGSGASSCTTSAPGRCWRRSPKSATGAGQCRPAPHRASPSTPSTTPSARRWWRSTAGPRPSTDPSATV